MNNVEVVIDTLNSLQNYGIHSFKEYVPEGSDYFHPTLGRAHIIREEKMGATENQALTIQKRSLKP